MKNIGKYHKHIFICHKEREKGNSKGCCASKGGAEIRLKLLELIQEHGLKEKVRANISMCLDACELAPVMVIYPQNIWYTGFSLADVEDLFQASILNDDVVEEFVSTEKTWQSLKEIRLHK